MRHIFMALSTSYPQHFFRIPYFYPATLRLPPKNNSPHLLPGTIASLAAFTTRILTTVLAGILSGSPVAGLRPIRAFTGGRIMVTGTRVLGRAQKRADYLLR
jgi:hypothetical protein